ncbi:MAG TPA: vWA domain-containing protein [Kofleriaceae bacterium]|nr:vWA domain-containing protein [Kofleriaceae bacterium]
MYSFQSRFYGIAVAFSTVALLACGDGGSRTSPCDTVSPPESCGEMCQGNGDCGEGLYCAQDGTCTADCPAGNPQSCGEGQLCTETGQCIPDPNADTDGGNTNPGGDADCPSVVVNLESVTPTVVLLIDQSGSMSDGFGQIGGNNVDRWEAAQVTLGADDGIVANLQASVRFGAVLYTGDNRAFGDDPDPKCPRLKTANPGDSDDAPMLEPRLNNHERIQDLLFSHDPVDDTPTGDSLEKTANQLAALPPADPDNPEPKIIVLATDGEPDSCEIPDPQGAAAQAEAVAAAQGAYVQGIETIVLGISNDIPENKLQEMANAGSGQDIDNGNAKFYTADDPDELVSAFQSIIGGVAKSCQLNLDGSIAQGSESSGDVRLDGNPLTYGTDWQVVDSNTIELIGDACQEYLDNPGSMISAEFPCGTIIDPE